MTPLEGQVTPYSEWVDINPSVHGFAIPRQYMFARFRAFQVYRRLHRIEQLLSLIL